MTLIIVQASAAGARGTHGQDKRTNILILRHDDQNLAAKLMIVN
jgi:hypothetical protein